MAMYDRSKTRSFYSEIAHAQDVCHYCEKAIREKRDRREITHDEMNYSLRKLVGAMTGKRVAKFRYVGHEFCICPDCLKNICSEVFPKEETIAITDELAVVTQEEVVDEPIVDEKQSEKKKAGGKNASSKKS